MKLYFTTIYLVFKLILLQYLLIFCFNLIPLQGVEALPYRLENVKTSYADKSISSEEEKSNFALETQVDDTLGCCSFDKLLLDKDGVTGFLENLVSLIKEYGPLSNIVKQFIIDKFNKELKNGDFYEPNTVNIIEQPNLIPLHRSDVVSVEATGPERILLLSGIASGNNQLSLGIDGVKTFNIIQSPFEENNWKISNKNYNVKPSSIEERTESFKVLGKDKAIIYGSTKPDNTISLGLSNVRNFTVVPTGTLTTVKTTSVTPNSLSSTSKFNVLGRKLYSPDNGYGSTEYISTPYSFEKNKIDDKTVTGQDQKSQPNFSIDIRKEYPQKLSFGILGGNNLEITGVPSNINEEVTILIKSVDDFNILSSVRNEFVEGNSYIENNLPTYQNETLHIQDIIKHNQHFVAKHQSENDLRKSILAVEVNGNDNWSVVGTQSEDKSVSLTLNGFKNFDVLPISISKFLPSPVYQNVNIKPVDLSTNDAIFKKDYTDFPDESTITDKANSINGLISNTNSILLNSGVLEQYYRFSLKVKGTETLGIDKILTDSNDKIALSISGVEDFDVVSFTNVDNSFALNHKRYTDDQLKHLIDQVNAERRRSIRKPFTLSPNINQNIFSDFSTSYPGLQHNVLSIEVIGNNRLLSLAGIQTSSEFDDKITLSIVGINDFIISPTKISSVAGVAPSQPKENAEISEYEDKITPLNVQDHAINDRQFISTPVNNLNEDDKMYRIITTNTTTTLLTESYNSKLSLLITDLEEFGIVTPKTCFYDKHRNLIKSNNQQEDNEESKTELNPEKNKVSVHFIGINNLNIVNSVTDVEKLTLSIKSVDKFEVKPVPRKRKRIIRRKIRKHTIKTTIKKHKTRFNIYDVINDEEESSSEEDEDLNDDDYYYVYDVVEEDIDENLDITNQQSLFDIPKTEKMVKSDKKIADVSVSKNDDTVQKSVETGVLKHDTVEFGNDYLAGKEKRSSEEDQYLGSDSAITSHKDKGEIFSKIKPDIVKYQQNDKLIHEFSTEDNSAIEVDSDALEKLQNYHKETVLSSGRISSEKEEVNVSAKSLTSEIDSHTKTEETKTAKDYVNGSANTDIQSQKEVSQQGDIETSGTVSSKSSVKIKTITTVTITRSVIDHKISLTINGIEGFDADTPTNSENVSKIEEDTAKITEGRKDVDRISDEAISSDQKSLPEKLPSSTEHLRKIYEDIENQFYQGQENSDTDDEEDEIFKKDGTTFAKAILPPAIKKDIKESIIEELGALTSSEEEELEQLDIEDEDYVDSSDELSSSDSDEVEVDIKLKIKRKIVLKRIISKINKIRRKIYLRKRLAVYKNDNDSSSEELFEDNQENPEQGNQDSTSKTIEPHSHRPTLSITNLFDLNIPGSVFTNTKGVAFNIAGADTKAVLKPDENEEGKVALEITGIDELGIATVDDSGNDSSSPGLAISGIDEVDTSAVNPPKEELSPDDVTSDESDEYQVVVTEISRKNKKKSPNSENKPKVIYTLVRKNKENDTVTPVMEIKDPELIKAVIEENLSSSKLNVKDILNSQEVNKSNKENGQSSKSLPSKLNNEKRSKEHFKNKANQGDISRGTPVSRGSPRNVPPPSSKQRHQHGPQRHQHGPKHHQHHNSFNSRRMPPRA